MSTVFRGLLVRQPPKGRKRLIIGTTSERTALQQLGLTSHFNTEIAVPNIDKLPELWPCFRDSKLLGEATAMEVYREMEDRYGKHVSVGVKYVMTAIAAAASVEKGRAVEAFLNQLEPKMQLILTQ
jgi:vesicle-fusing ATPase